MSVDEENDLFATTYFCCFLWLHLFDLSLRDQGKQEATHWFSFNLCFFHYKFWLPGTNYSHIAKIYFFQIDYFRLACFKVVCHVESSNIARKSNGCVKCLFRQNTLTLLTQFRYVGLSCFCQEDINYPTGGLWRIVQFGSESLLQSRTSLAWACSLWAFIYIDIKF